MLNPLPALSQEHLVLVCELLRANLYEFQRYNRDSGGDPYFTLPRIQSVARQVGGLGCLQAAVPGGHVGWRGRQQRVGQLGGCTGLLCKAG